MQVVGESACGNGRPFNGYTLPNRRSYDRRVANHHTGRQDRRILPALEDQRVRVIWIPCCATPCVRRAMLMSLSRSAQMPGGVSSTTLIWKTNSRGYWADLWTW